MRIVTTAAVVAGLIVAGCDQRAERLPDPVPLRSQLGPDPGFTIKPRPGCSADVIAALRDRDASAIARVASQGGNFTCGAASDPLPLDETVLNSAPGVVRALLEARADPNARWSSRGDRFPLQDAIEARLYGRSAAHRPEIIRLLLRHGADPNARWCPFESRGTGSSLPPCRSEWGVTPLMMAAALDQADATYLLLDAGADTALEDQWGANALDHARSGAVFYLLLGSVVPNAKGRAIEALTYLGERHPKSVVPGPWDETPLARAIVRGDGSYVLPPPPPPPKNRASHPVTYPPYRRLRAERVSILLTIGADPNQRLSWGAVDWTPLALAVAVRDVDVAESLLMHGADANARWCVPAQVPRPADVSTPAPGCTRERGTTPLMLAASLGAVDMVRLLLQYGADPTHRDWEDQTAFGYAVSVKSEEVAKALSERIRSR